MSWQRVDLSAPEYARPTEPPITCGLLYRSRRHSITGPPEATKTLTALLLGLEHMRGGHGTFALVDFEMGEHAIRLLLDELGATADEIAAVYYVTADAPPQQDDIDALSAANVSLAIIDAAAGAYDTSGLDDNKRADTERFGRVWVEPLWRQGIATVVLDHVVKNTEARGRYAIGSERKLGAVDVALGLEAVRQLHRGHTGLVRIVTHKDRPGHLPRPTAAELELASDPDTHRITWKFKAAGDDAAGEDGRFRPTVLMDRVLEFVTGQPEPVSRKTVTDAVRGKREWVIRAIDILVHEGHLGEQRGARGAKLLTTPPVPVPHLFPEQLGTREGNDLFPVPSLQGEQVREQVAGTGQPEAT